MRLLLDTNCWMQLVRKRPHADEVRALLRDVPPSAVLVTDYGVHTLILLMRRHGVLDELEKFVAESGFGTSVVLVDVPPARFGRIVEVMNAYRLDVDDSYHYVAAELHNLELVSLDADFDRTPRGRLEPLVALSQYQASQQQNP